MFRVRCNLAVASGLVCGFAMVAASLTHSQTTTSSSYSPRLGIRYEWVRLTGTTALGARLTADAPASSPLGQANVGLERGDIITALDGTAITGAAELERHHSQTSVTFINVRTGGLEARWVNLPPMEGAAAAGVGVASAPALDSAGVDKYGAIAYSQSTGRYGYGWGKSSRSAAESTALSECGRGDAFIAVWGKNCWLALASGNGTSYGWGWDGSSEGAAQSTALARSAQHARGAHIRVSFYSGGVGTGEVIVRAPLGARVITGNLEVPMSNGVGRFQCPGLLGGKANRYVLTCYANQGGKTVTGLDAVNVFAFETAEVEFDETSFPAALPDLAEVPELNDPDDDSERPVIEHFEDD